MIVCNSLSEDWGRDYNYKINIIRIEDVRGGGVCLSVQLASLEKRILKPGCFRVLFPNHGFANDVI